MKTTLLKTADLHPCKDNPFLVLDNNDMQMLIDSIKENGILNPIIVRTRAEGGYEIISGHRRFHACRKLGIDHIPAIINELSREDAIIAMVDSNLHRDGLLPSEKARAYRMKNDVLKHQGKRTDLTSRQNGEKLTEELTITQIANIVNDSERTIQRYIRLTYLIPELLDMVDEKKIAITPAVEISYLPEELQKELLLTIDCEQAVPSLSQAQQMRKANERGELNGDMIFKIMIQRKANQAEPLKISQDILKKYFSPDATPRHMVEVIEKALDYYASHLHQIKRSRDAR